MRAGVLSLAGGEERCEVSQPFLPTGDEISRGKGVCDFLQAIGGRAFQEGIAPLVELDALVSHAICQPVMLIEANPGGEWKIRADSDEHSSPDPVVDVEVVLGDPAVSDLQMPSVLTSDGNHDTSRLSCFKDDYDLVGLGSSEIRVNEFVATALRRFHDRNIALGCSLFHPALESFGNVSQGMASYWVKLAIRIEETYNPLGLLERLNQAIEKNARSWSAPDCNIRSGKPAAILGSSMTPVAILFLSSPSGVRDIKGEALG
jgi:hypothetical protein